MRPYAVTISGSVTGAPLPLDYMIAPFQISISVGNVTGTIAATLQYTYDDVFDPAYVAGSGNWFTSSLMSGITAAGDMVINAAPVRAVRFVNVGTGSFIGRVIQAGTGM